MRRRLKARKVIPIGILAVCLLLMYKVFWLDKHIEKEKAVLYVEVVEEFEKKIRKENCIIIPDCKEYLTDYDSEKQTLLYINNQDELVEKNLWTGEATVLNIGVDGDVSNLRYGPENDEISYIKERDHNTGDIYIYNMNEDIEKKVTDCVYSYWRNTYAWKDKSTLFTINRVGERYMQGLFVWGEDSGRQPIEDVSSPSCCIALSKDNKIYYILEWLKFNGITIESRYKLMEVDLKNNKVKELTDIDTQSNFLLECIDDKYLVYVEEGSYERRSKVYCYYIETGEKKCIYKTNKKIVGVFVK